MQTIDSVKPPTPRAARVAAPPPHPRMSGTEQNSADIRPVVRQKVTPRPSAIQTGARFTKLPSQKKKRSIPWASLCAVVGSVLLIPAAHFGLIGMVLAGLYVLASLLFLWPSRLSFIVALLGLLYVIGLQFSGSVKDAQAVAGLVYIFFVGGGLRLAFEVRHDTKLWFKKH